MPINSFETLCCLASKERWCWKLYCTTCGTMHLRYSLIELAKGKSPEDIDWPINNKRTRNFHELGKLPRVFSEEVKKEVLEICSDSSLDVIVSNCTFPDWLGYLGFVLEHMRTSSNGYKTVSGNWVPQLLNIAPLGTRSHDRLHDLLLSKETLLVKDLEIFEGDILMKKGRL